MKIVEECHNMKWMKQLISNCARPTAGGMGKGDYDSEGYGIGM